jgi:hypothetical protein
VTVNLDSEAITDMQAELLKTLKPALEKLTGPLPEAESQARAAFFNAIERVTGLNDERLRTDPDYRTATLDDIALLSDRPSASANAMQNRIIAARTAVGTRDTIPAFMRNIEGDHRDELLLFDDPRNTQIAQIVYRTTKWSPVSGGLAELQTKLEALNALDTAEAPKRFSCNEQPAIVLAPGARRA